MYQYLKTFQSFHEPNNHRGYHMSLADNLKNLINAYLNNVVNDNFKATETISRKKSILFLESLRLEDMSSETVNRQYYFFNASSQDSEAYNSLSIKRLKNVTGNFVYNFFYL